MSAVNVRNISLETHNALRRRAAQHGRSTEAEIRFILEEAVRPQNRVKLGSLLASIAKDLGGVDLSISRDPAPLEAAPFE